jgi:Flp pilus assembly protein TadB
MSDKHDLPGFRGLEVIAGFKFLQATTLILAGLGAFGLMNPGVSDAAGDWIERLAAGNGQRFAVAAATRILPIFNAATPRHFAAFWRGKKWAEYLTIGVTASLLPVEVMALVHRVTLVRIATLVINTLVIVYLLWELRARSRKERAQALEAR